MEEVIRPRQPTVSLMSLAAYMILFNRYYLLNTEYRIRNPWNILAQLFGAQLPNNGPRTLNNHVTRSSLRHLFDIITGDVWRN